MLRRSVTPIAQTLFKDTRCNNVTELFQKYSYRALRKTQIRRNFRSKANVKYEKIKKILEQYFSINKPPKSDSENKAKKDNCKKCEKILEEIFGIAKENYDKNLATKVKLKEEELITKIETIKDAKLVKKDIKTDSATVPSKVLGNKLPNILLTKRKDNFLEIKHNLAGKEPNSLLKEIGQFGVPIDGKIKTPSGNKSEKNIHYFEFFKKPKEASENASLNELLKRVRQKNKMLWDEKSETLRAKCSPKYMKCSPPSSIKCPPYPCHPSSPQRCPPPRGPELPKCPPQCPPPERKSPPCHPPSPPRPPPQRKSPPCHPPSPPCPPPQRKSPPCQPTHPPKPICPPPSSPQPPKCPPVSHPSHPQCPPLPKATPTPQRPSCPPPYRPHSAPTCPPRKPPACNPPPKCQPKHPPPPKCPDPCKKFRPSSLPTDFIILYSQPKVTKIMDPAYLAVQYIKIK